MPANYQKILFIVNKRAGKSDVDWSAAIKDFYAQRSEQIELFEMPDPCSKDIIGEKIKSSSADLVVAVGGDGTLKLVAELVQGSNIAIGLLPAGSANGMAKELNIPVKPDDALATLAAGLAKKISLVKINDELCIHLADMGFNAYVVKKFEDEKKRGMWSYVRSAWKVLWSHDSMKVSIKVDDETINREAAMVVIANATRYGTGVVINPMGKLDDDLFEVVIVKKISFSEIFKMRFLDKEFNPKKTELLQTRSLTIDSGKKIHFQIDGEYMGKVKKVKAEIITGALTIIVGEEPATSKEKKK